jgi:hypothetical protein
MSEIEVDAVVEEVQAVRQAFAREHDYDIDAMVRALQEESIRKQRKLVALPPRYLDDDEGFRPEGTHESSTRP